MKKEMSQSELIGCAMIQAAAELLSFFPEENTFALSSYFPQK